MQGLCILSNEERAQKLASIVLNLHDDLILLKFQSIVDVLLVRCTFGLIHGLSLLFVCEVEHAYT